MRDGERNGDEKREGSFRYSVEQMGYAGSRRSPCIDPYKISGARSCCTHCY